MLYMCLIWRICWHDEDSLILLVYTHAVSLLYETQFLPSFVPNGTTARGGPWPPLQHTSKLLGFLLCRSIRWHPSFWGPWTRHPTISFLVFLFVLSHTAWNPVHSFHIVAKVISEFLSTRRYASGVEERPPDMEGSYEYTEQAFADSRQGVVLQLEGWWRC